MVTTKPDHQGEHGANRKTIRAGNAGESGVPVVTVLVWFFSFPREAMGASSAPGIPCALFFGGTWFSSKLGRNASRECEVISMLFDKSNQKIARPDSAHV